MKFFISASLTYRFLLFTFTTSAGCLYAKLNISDNQATKACCLPYMEWLGPQSKFIDQ